MKSFFFPYLASILYLKGCGSGLMALLVNPSRLIRLRKMVATDSVIIGTNCIKDFHQVPENKHFLIP